MDQVIENIKVAQTATENSFIGTEKQVIEDVRNVFRQRVKVNCTDCGYCMPCPSGVNIPGCFSFYNNYHVFGREEMYRMLQPGQRASACIECGQCETNCPQSIEIIKELKNVRAIFEPA